MSRNVKNIRRRIDILDDKIHDLLMDRVELVSKIGAEKKKHKLPVVQPDREIIMVRRLLERHKGPLPKEAVVRIWRELVGAVSLLQTGLKVVVTVPETADGLMYWDLAKDYFSSVLPIQRTTDPQSALALVREGEMTFAVLPWPEDSDNLSWWSFLIDESGDEPMRITARLPLGDRDLEDHMHPVHKALVVSRASFEPSGDDCSFLSLQVDADVSRARVIDKLNEAGMEVLGLYALKQPYGGGFTYLAEVKTYVAAEDDRLRQLLDALDNPEGRCICLGGYPVPPSYKAAPVARVKSGSKKSSGN